LIFACIQYLMIMLYGNRSTDYCTECYGRGYNLTYNLIDLRSNQVSENEFAYDSLPRSPLNTSEYDMPPAKPIHRGKAPRPLSSYSFIGIFFYAIIALAVLWIINQITAQ